MTSLRQRVEAKLSELYPYLSKPRVCGLYVGGTADDPQIVVHFEGEEPLPAGELPSSVKLDLGPGVGIFEVPVRAFAAGQHELQPAEGGNAPRAGSRDLERAERPCPGGMPIEGVAGPGTLGVNVDWPPAAGAFCLLSNNHVISLNGVGEPIYQPRETTRSLIAKTTGYAPVHTYGSPDEPSPVFTRQDLAWAAITYDMGSPCIRKSSTSLILPGGIHEPRETERVWLVGARSNELHAYIASVCYAVKVAWPRPGCGTWAWFKDQILLSKSVTSHGDSGAVYLTDAFNMLVGIHVGANNLGSWGSPLILPGAAPR
jgi:hypothetical protein